MVLSTEWSQVEVIDLYNDGNGLGFILVGGRSTGVVIKSLTPGGVAERDARLQCGDHLLQIGDVNLRGFSSEQVATVLRQTGPQVRLIVARPIEPAAVDIHNFASHAPIIPTKLLSDPDELSRHLYENPSFVTSATTNLGGCLLQTPDTELADLPLPPIPSEVATDGLNMYPKDLDIVPFSIVSPPATLPHSAGTPLSEMARHIHEMNYTESVISGGDQKISPNEINEDGGHCFANASCNYPDSPETETYVVKLRKNVYGLGITVAGYVCEEEDLSGIFVKSIIEGSAAEMSGQIQINDRIVAVDGKTFAGVTNHQAVEMLRNTDIEVDLTLERFLRGRKYEHLQVALTELKADSQSQASLPASPSIATLTWLPPKSDADSTITDGGVITVDVIDFPSRATVDSNLSNLLNKSEHSVQNGICNKTDNGQDTTTTFDTVQSSRLVNGSTEEMNGNGVDSGNDTDDGTIELPPPPPLPYPDEIKPNTNLRTPTSEMVADTVAMAQMTASAVCKTPLQKPSMEALRVAWKSEFPESEIIVAEINKLSGLGISLEGTVDVEGGIEKRPHHYIRSILADGPVGRQGILKPGDELLQVNEYKLQGLKHIEVVKILKELPAQVKLVCARGPSAPSVINTSQNAEAFETRSLLPGGHQSLQNLLCKAQSESSLYTSSTATLTDQHRSKSVENVSGLALWSTDVTLIDIEKTEQGFGFSILDYQDPLDPEGSVIVIRGLIRGGSAETTNEIFPGDRLVSVGEHNLQSIELDEAVRILKGMPLGRTKLGICRPLSTSDSNVASPAPEEADRESPST